MQSSILRDRIRRARPRVCHFRHQVHKSEFVFRGSSEKLIPFEGSRICSFCRCQFPQVALCQLVTARSQRKSFLPERTARLVATRDQIHVDTVETSPLSGRPPLGSPERESPPRRGGTANGLGPCTFFLCTVIQSYFIAINRTSGV